MQRLLVSVIRNHDVIFKMIRIKVNIYMRHKFLYESIFDDCTFNVYS